MTSLSVILDIFNRGSRVFSLSVKRTTLDSRLLTSGMTDGKYQDQKKRREFILMRQTWKTL